MYILHGGCHDRTQEMAEVDMGVCETHDRTIVHHLIGRRISKIVLENLGDLREESGVDAEREPLVDCEDDVPVIIPYVSWDVVDLDVSVLQSRRTWRSRLVDLTCRSSPLLDQKGQAARRCHLGGHKTGLNPDQIMAYLLRSGYRFRHSRCCYAPWYINIWRSKAYSLRSLILLFKTSMVSV